MQDKSKGQSWAPVSNLTIYSISHARKNTQ